MRHPRRRRDQDRGVVHPARALKPRERCLSDFPRSGRAYINLILVRAGLLNQTSASRLLKSLLIFVPMLLHLRHELYKSGFVSDPVEMWIAVPKLSWRPSSRSLARRAQTSNRASRCPEKPSALARFLRRSTRQKSAAL